MGATLSVWSEVARGPIAAEGAVVKREQKIPEAIIVAGNPAKEIGAVSQQERAFWDWTNKIYLDLAQKYCDLGMEKVETP